MSFPSTRRILLAALLAIGMAPLHAQTEIKIGLISPSKSLVGKQLLQGAELAADMVNADGGVLGGRKLKLVPYDTAFQPNEGVSSAQRLITQDGVKIIVGEVSSTVGLAVLQVARASNVLFVAAVPKHPDLTKSGYDKVFRLNSTTEMDGEFLAALSADTKVQKVAIIAENSDFGRATVDGVKAKLGSRVVMAETYEMNQSDFSTLVTKAKASGADTVCVAGSNMEQYGNILRLQEELRVAARRCVMPGILNSKGVQIAGKGAEGAFSADIYVPTLPGALNKRFVDAYVAKYKETPEKIEMLGFEAVWVTALAIAKAGTSDDVNKLAQTLRGNTWQSPRGDLKFDAAGQASSGGLIRLGVTGGKLLPTK